MNLAELLVKAQRTFPDRPALAVGTNPPVSYAKTADRVARIAKALRSIYGLAPGDRVAIAMKNCPAFFEILFAAWHAGLVAIPMNAKLHAREFAYILENSGARLAFATPDLAEALGEAAASSSTPPTVIDAASPAYEALFDRDSIEPVEVDGDDLAWIFYTSGTTGFPKGAMLSHRNLLSMTLSYFADVDHVAETDCIIHAAAMSHGSGLYILPFVAKAACHVIPESGGFEPDEIFALLRHYRGATVFFAPTMVMRLINDPGFDRADMSSLKTIVYGGGPMYAEDSIRALERLGPKLVQIYGQGESPMTITVLPRAAHTNRDDPRYLDRLASVGIAHTTTEVRTVDDNGDPVGIGEIGEVVVRGDVVMKGYWQNPDATAQALRDGWLHTGDMGSFDADGFLTLKDRSKDVIISGGSNIYPREVEEVLLRHADIAEVSVVGRPHADWGEEVVAFVVARARAPLDEAELDQLCLDNMARFKRPKAYRFVDALPKNNYGKVLKTALREMLNDDAAAQTPATA